MASWINITKPILIKTDIETVENNINYIIEHLNDMSYNIDVIVPQVVKYNSNLSNILVILNKVESELSELNSDLDFITNFNSFKWTSATINKVQRVQQWIDYINYLYKVVNGETVTYAYLIDSANSFVVDNENKLIIVRVN